MHATALDKHQRSISILVIFKTPIRTKDYQLYRKGPVIRNWQTLWTSQDILFCHLMLRCTYIHYTTIYVNTLQEKTMSNSGPKESSPVFMRYHETVVKSSYCFLTCIIQFVWKKQSESILILKTSTKICRHIPSWLKSGKNNTQSWDSNRKDYI
jgi:hypothetical protein